MARKSEYLCYVCGVELIEGENWDSSHGRFICEKCRPACPACGSKPYYSTADPTHVSCRECGHRYPFPQKPISIKKHWEEKRGDLYKFVEFWLGFQWFAFWILVIVGAIFIGTDVDAGPFVIGGAFGFAAVNTALARLYIHYADKRAERR